MTAVKDYKDDFVLLLEAGFVAMNQLDEESATKLFHGAQTLRPESFEPRVGLAAIALHKLQTDKSIAILEDVMNQGHENYLAGALLGISYILSNQKIDKGQMLLKEAMEKADDTATKRLGTLWLEVIEKGLAKSQSPAKPQKPKKT